MYSTDIVDTEYSTTFFISGYDFLGHPIHRRDYCLFDPYRKHAYAAEYYAIIEALSFISKLSPNNYLKAIDYLSCLQTLESNPFNYKLSPLVVHIKSYIKFLNQINGFVQYLWVSSYIGIHGNKVAYRLAKSTSSTIIVPSISKLTWIN